MASNYYKHKSFLNYIGIKSEYIYEFLNSLSDNELKEENYINIFKKYLKYNEHNLENLKCPTLRSEKAVFERMGFRSHDSYVYVGLIKNVYLEDSTINWIYRLIESKLTTDGYHSYKNFVSKCHQRKRLRRF